MPFTPFAKKKMYLLSSGYCANPGCRKKLLENDTIIGEACHINGEKEDSARYSSQQNEKERNGHENGLMLCPNCHTIVDNDESTYTTELLFLWKKNDEESQKLREWIEKGIPSAEIMLRVQEQLPIRPSSYLGERTLFIGRSSEISNASDLIRSGIRILTIAGEGGIGKTALTVRIIKNCQSLFDIIIPINLVNGMKFQDFLLEIGNYMGIPSMSIDFYRTKLESLIRQIFLNVGRVLLFVENYENVADFISSSESKDLFNIQSFLESIPTNVTVIINSRNRSNIEGETIQELNGLSKDDGKNLFIEMAKRYLPKPVSLEVDESIDKICELVGGHPLAIKLVAGAYKGGGVSRLNSMHEELYSNIKNMKDDTPRFRSIRACFDYSYTRLSPKLKKALIRLLLFKSYFTYDSANQILGIPESILVELYERTFVQRSVIQCKEGSELFVHNFHPVVRNYLTSKLENKIEFSPTQLQRYIRYHFDYIRKIDKAFKDDYAKYSTLLDLFTGENVNDLSESIHAIVNTREKSYISNLLGILLLQTGHKSRALVFHQLCFEIDTANQEPDRIANDLDNIAACTSDSAISVQSISYRLQAAEFFEKNNRDMLAGREYASVGLVYIRQGKIDLAEFYCKKALTIFRRLESSDHEIAGTLLNFIGVFLQKKQYNEAIECSLECKIIYKKLDDKLSVANANRNLSLSYLKRNNSGDLDAALDSIRESIETDVKDNNIRALIRDYRITSDIYKKKNDGKTSLEYDEKAKTLIGDLEKITQVPFDDKQYSDYLQL